MNEREQKYQGNVKKKDTNRIEGCKRYITPRTSQESRHAILDTVDVRVKNITGDLKISFHNYKGINNDSKHL